MLDPFMQDLAWHILHLACKILHNARSHKNQYKDCKSLVAGLLLIKHTRYTMEVYIDKKTWKRSLCTVSGRRQRIKVHT